MQKIILSLLLLVSTTAFAEQSANSEVYRELLLINELIDTANKNKQSIEHDYKALLSISSKLVSGVDPLYREGENPSILEMALKSPLLFSNRSGYGKADFLTNKIDKNFVFANQKTIYHKFIDYSFSFNYGAGKSSNDDLKKVIEMLILKGFPINKADSDGVTPISLLERYALENSTPRDGSSSFGGGRDGRVKFIRGLQEFMVSKGAIKSGVVPEYEAVKVASCDPSSRELFQAGKLNYSMSVAEYNDAYPQYKTHEIAGRDIANPDIDLYPLTKAMYVFGDNRTTAREITIGYIFEGKCDSKEEKEKVASWLKDNLCIDREIQYFSNYDVFVFGTENSNPFIGTSPGNQSMQTIGYNSRKEGDYCEGELEIIQNE